MRIILFDPVTYGFSHAAFNASMILSFCSVNKIKSLTIMLEKNQITHPYIQSAINESPLQPLVLPLPTSKNSLITKIARSIKSHILLIFRVLIEKPNVICFLASDNTFSPFFLTLISAITNRTKSRLLIVFHNNLENMKNNHLKLRLWETVIRITDVRLIVLSPFLKKRVKLHIPSASVVCIPHPSYTEFRGSPQVYIPYSEKLYDFLFLGRHAYSLNGKEFLANFINECSSFNINRCVKIVISADVQVGDLYCPSNVELITYRYPITDFMYDKLLQESRFVVVPPDSAYRLTASGVLADSITFGVPIIAPKAGPFMDSVSETCYSLLYKHGNFIPALQMALSITPDIYYNVTKDILKLREELSISNTAKRLALLTTGLL